MNDNILYEKILEKILQEFSGVGAIAGAVPPLGADAQAGSGNKPVYKDSKSTDKKYRSKDKKKENKSIHWYLKNNK